MTTYDKYLPALDGPPEDALEAHVWALLDGPRGQLVPVPENVLRAGIECLRLLASGGACCSEAAMQVANTVNRLLPGFSESGDLGWDALLDPDSAEEQKS